MVKLEVLFTASPMLPASAAAQPSVITCKNQQLSSLGYIISPRGKITPVWCADVGLHSEMPWSHGDIFDSYRGVHKAWAYVGGYVGAMLGLCSAKNGAFFLCLVSRPKRTRYFLGHAGLGLMVGLYWSMLGFWGHVGAMLGPHWGHVGAMLSLRSAERRVRFGV